jgi:hypothetical protein
MSCERRTRRNKKRIKQLKMNNLIMSNMKRITTIITALLLSAATFAQAPQGFSYQAVVRDAHDSIAANQTFDITLAILQGATADAAKAVYTETHTVTTNQNGLFTLAVGGGSSADNFSAINWAAGTFFLKTESPYGTSVAQLLSVPFAMYAAKAASADIDLSPYALKTDIPAEANLEGYAKTADIEATYALKTDIPTIPSIPTKTSDLENDSNFLTQHQSLAAYTTTAKLTDTLAAYTTTVDIAATYALKSDIPSIPSIPTKTSDLENDSNFLTEHQSLAAYTTTAELTDTLAAYTTTVDIAAAYALKSDIPIIPSIPTKTSDLENDSNFLTQHQDITGKADKSEMTITNGTGTATITLKTGTSATVLTQHQDISGKLDATTAEATYAKKTDIETELAAIRDIIKKQEFKIALLSGDIEVDLGLTSGNLWATCNLGATSPEQYGDYYAWGETEPYYSSQDPLTWKDGKTGYNWANYTKLSGGSSSTLTKYNTKAANGTVDNKTVLEAEDDAATANWGGGWAMPTTDEFQELYNECYWFWTTDYNGTGIAGYIVYKSVDKNTDKQCTKGSDHTYSVATDTHIFLPAAGNRFNASLSVAGSRGYYWSASLYASNPSSARDLYFNSGYVSPAYGNVNRYCGFPVRPVRRP